MVLPVIVCCLTTSMSAGSCGAGVPLATICGDCSTRISSYRWLSMNDCRVCLPPSTIIDCMLLSCAAFISTRSTSSSESCPSMPGSGSVACESTIFTGDGPAQWRTVSCGCSRSSVVLPTTMASFSALSLCMSISVVGVDMASGLPPLSMNPFAVCAHFSVMNGRWRLWKVKKRLFNRLHSSSSTPTVTSIPASRRRFMPRPCTSAKGSMHPTTARRTPFFTMRSAHGGVLPQ